MPSPRRCSLHCHFHTQASGLLRTRGNAAKDFTWKLTGVDQRPSSKQEEAEPWALLSPLCYTLVLIWKKFPGPPENRHQILTCQVSKTQFKGLWSPRESSVANEMGSIWGTKNPGPTSTHVILKKTLLPEVSLFLTGSAWHPFMPQTCPSQQSCNCIVIWTSLEFWP